MQRPLKIGTRESKLALVQTHFIKNMLFDLGIATEIVPIQSDGDINLVQPLYALGVQGIFTKTLDAALLNHTIDIAVHSFKDVPTQLPHGLCICLVPERASPYDVLVFGGDVDANIDDFDAQAAACIATSSLRRRAQWLHRYPHHTTQNIRGNIQTRLQKLQNNTDYKAAIFAQAAFDRLALTPPNAQMLHWMLPAPAQGALAVICRTTDADIIQALEPLNHADTLACTTQERSFLRTLHGGCSVPIACHATIHKDMMTIKGNVLSEDGTQKIETELEIMPINYHQAGEILAYQITKMGANNIINTFRNKI